MTEYTPLWDAIYEFAEATDSLSNSDNYSDAHGRLVAALASHDAEVAANALREAATGVDMSHPSGPLTHRTWLRNRADRIEREHHNSV